MTSVLPMISQALGFILSSVLSLLNQSTAFIKELPCSTTEFIWLSHIQILLYYFAIVLIAAWLIRKSSLYLRLALLIVIAFILSDIWLQCRRFDQKELLVYNIANSSVINYIDGTNNLLFYNNSGKIKEEIKRYTRHYWVSKGINTCKTYKLPSTKKKSVNPVALYKNFICLHGIKLGYISDKNVLNKLSPEKKLELDYLILANDVNISPHELRRNFDFQMVILDSSNSYYHRKKLSQEMAKNGIQFHSVFEDGAFRFVFD